jgi:hypothetical protein
MRDLRSVPIGMERQNQPEKEVRDRMGMSGSMAILIGLPGDKVQDPTGEIIIDA